MTLATTRLATRIDNVNRDVLNHYMRAIAGTLAHFATSTDELR